MLRLKGGIRRLSLPGSLSESSLPNFPISSAALANAFIVKNVLADTGYYSENNTNGCEARQIEPYIAVGKQSDGILIKTIPGTAMALSGDMASNA